MLIDGVLSPRNATVENASSPLAAMITIILHFVIKDENVFTDSCMD